MLNNVKIKTIVFAAISAAVLSACGGGGGSSPSAELVNNASSARSVMDKIEALPAVEALTYSDQGAIKAALEAYQNAPNKSIITQASVDKLNALVAAYNANVALAQDIEAKITALPSEIAKSDESAVAAARANYEGLTAAQKTWVNDKSVSSLAAAEATVSKNKQLAEGVKSDIAALPTEIAKTDAAKVSAARKSLTDLTDAQETWVEAGFVSALAKAEATVAANQNKAAQVAGQISALPTNGLDIDTDEEIAAYTAAKKAFDDLSDSEETWVDGSASSKLAQVSEKTVIDDKSTSLAAINEPAPLPSAFLTRAVNNQAQQFNPQVQLRNDGGVLFDQPRLIKELAVDADTSVQDSIGLTAIGVHDLSNPGNPIGQIGHISKISSGHTNRNGSPTDGNNDAPSLPDVKKEYLDAKWSSIYAISTTTGVKIILRDPAEMGWNYQTFAYYNDAANNIAHAYQSVGTETDANAMPSSGTATYKGSTAGHYVENGMTKQLTADVNAVVDFSKKLVRFSTSNSQLHQAVNGVRVSDVKNDAFNMTGNGSWKGGNQFTGVVKTTNGLKGEVNGKFYGAGAAEIGGTYGLKSDKAQLIGGYGAKRQ